MAPSEKSFLQALELCQALSNFQYQPSTLPCQAIELLCEVSREPSILIRLLKKYANETQKALHIIDEYASNADNWRVKGQNCSLGFGVKDHCSILSFLLNLTSGQFKAFTGNFTASEKICELLKDWKKINFDSLLPQVPANL